MIKLCKRCFTMKNIRGKKELCKRCEEEFDKEHSEIAPITHTEEVKELRKKVDAGKVDLTKYEKMFEEPSHSLPKATTGEKDD